MKQTQEKNTITWQIFLSIFFSIVLLINFSWPQKSFANWWKSPSNSTTYRQFYPDFSTKSPVSTLNERYFVWGDELKVPGNLKRLKDFIYSHFEKFVPIIERGGGLVLLISPSEIQGFKQSLASLQLVKSTGDKVVDNWFNTIEATELKFSESIVTRSTQTNRLKIIKDSTVRLYDFSTSQRPIARTKIFDQQIVTDNLVELGVNTYDNSGFSYGNHQKDPAQLKGCGVRVCIIDSGIDYEHEDLKEQIYDGINFIPPKNPNYKIPTHLLYKDTLGHGTHVAGIIAAQDNDVGVIGVAPQSKLLIAKPFNSYGQATISDVAESILWCSQRGADIINMSFYLLTNTQAEQEQEALLKSAMQTAREHKPDIQFVAATGNYGIEMQYPPATYSDVISVGRIVGLSNFGPSLDVLAPGDNIISTFPNQRYVELSGTSMSTPHISGLLAIMKASGTKLVSSDSNEPYSYPSGYNYSDVFNCRWQSQLPLEQQGCGIVDGYLSVLDTHNPEVFTQTCTTNPPSCVFPNTWKNDKRGNEICVHHSLRVD